MANVTQWLAWPRYDKFNRFPIYDFLYAVNGNFCSRTHRWATIQNVTGDNNDGDIQTQHCSISATVNSRPYGRLKTECANLQQLILYLNILIGWTINSLANEIQLKIKKGWENFVDSVCGAECRIHPS